MTYPANNHVENTFKTLFSKIPRSEVDKTHIIIIAGEVTPYRNDTDRELIFRQESNFYYLTGCDIPSSYLIAISSPSNEQQLQIQTNLFIPEANEDDITWSIPPPSIEIASTLYQATSITYTKSLSGFVKGLINAYPNALYHTFPNQSPLFPIIPSSILQPILDAGEQTSQTSNGIGITDQYFYKAIQETRLIKDEYEIELIRKANAISSRAHETVMRVLGLAVQNKIRDGRKEGGKRPLIPGEWLIEKESEAEAIFVASCRREGSIHQAYLPIVAASSRASTLHYCCNDKEFSWGPASSKPKTSTSPFPSYTSTNEFPSPYTPHTTSIQPQVLLIDAGCEWSNYASDITRTMPLGNNGNFTKWAKEIYSLVLEMQYKAFEMIGDGVHWDLIHLECHYVLVRGFQKLGIIVKGNDNDNDNDNGKEKENDELIKEIIKSGLSCKFFPHGLGHSIGMDVHDVPGASKPVEEENKTILKEVLRERGCIEVFRYLRLRLPLQVGMVVTVEPGIYFSPHLLAPIRNSKYINHEVLKEYESVGGVRIEDVVVIKDNGKGLGCENLTTVRSDVEWIEGVCSGEI